MGADPLGRHMSKMYGDRHSMVKDREGTLTASVGSGRKLNVLDAA